MPKLYEGAYVLGYIQCTFKEAQSKKSLTANILFLLQKKIVKIKIVNVDGCKELSDLELRLLSRYTDDPERLRDFIAGQQEGTSLGFIYYQYYRQQQKINSDGIGNKALGISQ